MENLVRPVVVGYDGSEAAKAALDWATDEAVRRGAPLTVLYALEYGALVGGPVGTSPWLPTVALEAAHEVAAEGMERAARRAPGVEVSAATHPGRAFVLLTDASRTAQLLVVGTRGRGEVVSALLGSTAVTVAAHAECPVTVVAHRPDAVPGPLHPVVVGVDGSPGSDAAVRHAAAVAEAAGAPLTVVCGWQRPSAETWSGAYWFAVDEAADPDAAAERAAREVADAALRLAREVAPAVPAEARVTDAGPVRGILAEAQHAGLVVVGARGRGAFAGMVLGSVSQRVLHGAECPVTVVHTRRGATPVPRPETVDAAG